MAAKKPAKARRAGEPISFRASDITRRQINELMQACGESQSTTIIRAIAAAHYRLEAQREPQR